MENPYWITGAQCNSKFEKIKLSSGVFEAQILGSRFLGLALLSIGLALGDTPLASPRVKHPSSPPCLLPPGNAVLITRDKTRGPRPPSISQ